MAEQALQRELESASAGNTYMWRSVQRAVQSICDSFHTGLRAAQSATAAAARQALVQRLTAET